MLTTTGFATAIGKGPLPFLERSRTNSCSGKHILRILSRHLLSSKTQRNLGLWRVIPSLLSHRRNCLGKRSKWSAMKVHTSCKAEDVYRESNSQNVATDEERVKRMVCLYVGYIGTDYYGLQVNRQEGLKTVEEEIERALYMCGWISEHNFQKVQKISWSRASRTDKGVHACGNVIALKALVKEQWFSCTHDYKKTRQSARTKNDSDELAFSSLGPLKKDILEQLNRNLPESIRILGVQPVTKHFDARSRCSFRAYEYLMPLDAVPGASENLEKAIRRFEDILSLFKGTHRFHNFSSGLRAAHKKANARLAMFDQVKDTASVPSGDSQLSPLLEAEEETENNKNADDQEEGTREWEGNEDMDTENNSDSKFSDYVCSVIRRWPEHSSHRLKRQEYIRSIYIADIEGVLQIQGKT